MYILLLCKPPIWHLWCWKTIKFGLSNVNQEGALLSPCKLTLCGNEKRVSPEEFFPHPGSSTDSIFHVKTKTLNSAWKQTVKLLHQGSHMYSHRSAIWHHVKFPNIFQMHLQAEHVTVVLESRHMPLCPVPATPGIGNFDIASCNCINILYIWSPAKPNCSGTVLNPRIHSQCTQESV